MQDEVLDSLPKVEASSFVELLYTLPSKKLYELLLLHTSFPIQAISGALPKVFLFGMSSA